MNFLADESVDQQIVEQLRLEGHEVFYVAEMEPSIPDDLVMQRANEHLALLLTEDKDFGWLVYVSHADSAGVILIRFPGNARESLVDTVLSLLEQHQNSILGSFIILQPGYIRIRHKS